MQSTDIDYSLCKSHG